MRQGMRWVLQTAQMLRIRETGITLTRQRVLVRGQGRRWPGPTTIHSMNKPIEWTSFVAARLGFLEIASIVTLVESQPRASPVTIREYAIFSW